MSGQGFSVPKDLSARIAVRTYEQPPFHPDWRPPGMTDFERAYYEAMFLDMMLYTEEPDDIDHVRAGK